MTPELQQRQEASSAQRSPLVFLGVCPSLGPAMPSLRLLAGSLFWQAWSWHPPGTSSHPSGSHRALLWAQRAMGRWFLGTGAKGCARCAQPQQKSAALNMGFSVLLHMNSECENPACPSVP